MGTHPIFESDFDCLTEKKMSEGKEALGLTEHHQNQIRELLRYNRFKRSERLVGIELCFKDFIETRLYDDETYTQDEVRDMIEQVGQTVKDECESEFIHSSDTSALLLRQMMLQADQWKLKLSADVQQLENRALIQLIRDFEKMESNLSSTKSFNAQKLTPIQKEITRLQEENIEQRKKNTELEQRLSDALADKQKLDSDLKSVAGNIDADDAQKLKNDLLLVRQELAVKFRETAAYRNMKNLLEKKNVQIKELRGR